MSKQKSHGVSINMPIVDRQIEHTNIDFSPTSQSFHQAVIFCSKQPLLIVRLLWPRSALILVGWIRNYLVKSKNAKNR